MWLELDVGGEGQNRTADTTIFSRMLYQLSYLATGGITTIGELVTSGLGEFNHQITISPTHQFSRSYRVVYSHRKASIG